MHRLISISLVVTTGCATTLLRGTPKDAGETYEVAMEDLEDGLYPEALSGFTEVKTKYPYSKYAALADLRIADTHFERGKFVEAIDAYRNFLKFHPSHAEVAYAMFRIGEAYYEQIPEDWWFLPPSAEKDQASTRLAISAFRDLLSRFPDMTRNEGDNAKLEACQKKVETKEGRGLEDKTRGPLEKCRQMVAQQDLVRRGQERLDQCRRKLADHEMYVAEFYFKRDRFKAAAARADGILRDYAGLGLDPAALWLTAQSRHALEERELARAALERLTNEYADSGEADDGKKLLEKLSASPLKTPPQKPKIETPPKQD